MPFTANTHDLLTAYSEAFLTQNLRFMTDGTDEFRTGQQSESRVGTEDVVFADRGDDCVLAGCDPRGMGTPCLLRRLPSWRRGAAAYRIRLMAGWSGCGGAGPWMDGDKRPQFGCQDTAFGSCWLAGSPPALAPVRPGG